MFDEQPTLTLLFEQLGLASDEASILEFVKSHQLSRDTMLHEAEFWTDSQREFITSHWQKDDEWSLVVDELGTLLNQDAEK
ncbi:DUF2789 family protein [Acinetobacter stercoris]|uniref:DUF2789 domain-containing protein n=1 Tax=Acinetobacter stercoris TaxID=2126983 RepID=A0A2U3MWD7_9GAMM|nr:MULTISPECIES: DUF2789 family protein [Acinetobacter]SPL69695.1 hypothetical protein KPC_0873 [Acinetobacter stercoris]